MSELDIEFTESKLTLQAVAAENEQMRKQLILAQESLRNITDSLAVANGEAAFFKRQYSDLKLRMEALGVDSIGTDKARLEQRLLKAVRDLQLVQKEKNQMADQMVRMAEAMVRFMKVAVSVDPEVRMEVETQMRVANELLGISRRPAAEPGALPSSLTEGSVISVKDELALVVANLGSVHGVKMGMPFQVLRGEVPVGLVRVINVREKISGAVIQDLTEKEKIKVGDRLKVDARR